MSSAVSVTPRRKRGSEIPSGRRYVMALEIAMSIPPSNSNMFNGSLGPHTERYGVGPQQGIN